MIDVTGIGGRPRIGQVTKSERTGAADDDASQNAVERRGRESDRRKKERRKERKKVRMDRRSGGDRRKGKRGKIPGDSGASEPETPVRESM